MRHLLLIFLMLPMLYAAQDKVFFRDGTVRKGYLVSVTKDVVYFRASDTSATEKISKTKIAIIEDYKGKRYLFSETAAPANTSADVAAPPANSGKHRNIITAQPLALIFGRATLNYERLSKDQKMGFSIPFSLTFDPTGILYESELDTSASSVQRIRGVSYITGVDVHFYVGEVQRTRFFFGPRFRFGTDMFLRKTNGYSLQTELGWLSAAPDKGFAHSFSVGFGFVRLISAPSGSLVDPKQSYGWLSVNYKLGFKW